MGHLGFLIPNKITHQIEMLELARGFNPYYKPCAIRGFESQSQMKHLEETILKEVRENIDIMMNYKPGAGQMHV